MLRKDTQHALRALASLSRTQAPMALHELANKTGSPQPMLAKVLQLLSKHGFVAGRPGPGGGYHLARDAQDISLLDVVRSFEGMLFGKTCLMGHKSCEVNCPMHKTWGTFIAQLLKYLEETSVAQLAPEGTFASPQALKSTLL